MVVYNKAYISSEVKLKTGRPDTPSMRTLRWLKSSVSQGYTVGW